jgi:uncharacterized membrane protein YeaQ/YmgE (transglycosylase-associated protein family)
MELLVLAALGALLGWGVSLFLPGGEGKAWIHGSIGAVGAVLSGASTRFLFGSNAVPGGSVDAPNVLLALAGASLLLGVYRLLKRLSERR